jgi:membrane fusion protein, heavy metal efflux system
VRPGASFELSLSALPGQRFTGRVISASDFIDPLTRTIKIRAVVANPKRLLKAEMLATAHFERSFKSGVVVPAQSVLLSGTRHSVFVQNRPGEFEPRTVELAFEGSKEVVIASGLQAGELVVSENTLLLARQFRLAQDEASEKSPAEATPAAAAGKAMQK